MKHPEHPPHQDSKGPSPLGEVHCIRADLGLLHTLYHQQRRVQGPLVLHTLQLYKASWK